MKLLDGVCQETFCLFIAVFDYRGVIYRKVIRLKIIRVFRLKGDESMTR